MGNTKKRTALLYGDYYDTLKDYTLEQLGELFLMILFYANTGELPTSEDKEINGVFKMLKHNMDIDRKKYEEKCEKNRINGLKAHQK